MKESFSRRVRLRIWVMVRLLVGRVAWGFRARPVTTQTERIPNLPGRIDPNKTRMELLGQRASAGASESGLAFQVLVE
jgi:hypothetical protein